MTLLQSQLHRDALIAILAANGHYHAKSSSAQGTQYRLVSLATNRAVGEVQTSLEELVEHSNVLVGVSQ